MESTLTLTMAEIVQDFAKVFKEVDSSKPIGLKTPKFRPGIGPLNEAEAISLALAKLRSHSSQHYSAAAPARYPGSARMCDVLIPQSWAIEFKLLRPFGDNGREAEHWAEHVLHPYAGSSSLLGDALKLVNSDFKERLGVMVFGFEHNPPRIDIDLAVACFEVMARDILHLTLRQRCEAVFEDLVHPVHQRGKVYGWEVIRT